jgi:UDP-glucuronate 4-epimerase
VVNIGNSDMVRLLDFIEALEKHLGIKAIRHYMEIQLGDVERTWADATLLSDLTGYRPQTSVDEGVRRLVEWVRGRRSAA